MRLVTFLRLLLKAGLALAALLAGLELLAMAVGALRPREELAFVSLDGLEAMDVSAGLNHRVIRVGGYLGRPAWSPDSQMVAFTETDRASATPLIRVMDSRTGRPAFSNVIQAPGGQATWSPDGQWMAYAGAGGIYITRGDGSGGRVQVTDIGNLFPAWSPDGQQIAFVSQQIAGQGCSSSAWMAAACAT